MHKKTSFTMFLSIGILQSVVYWLMKRVNSKNYSRNIRYFGIVNWTILTIPLWPMFVLWCMAKHSLCFFKSVNRILFWRICCILAWSRWYTSKGSKTTRLLFWLIRTRWYSLRKNAQPLDLIVLILWWINIKPFEIIIGLIGCYMKIFSLIIVL